MYAGDSSNLFTDSAWSLNDFINTKMKSCVAHWALEYRTIVRCDHCAGRVSQEHTRDAKIGDRHVQERDLKNMIVKGQCYEQRKKETSRIKRIQGR